MPDGSMYSEMPKSESPKMGKRRNQNFWWFGFQHVPISDGNMSAIGTFLFWQFWPKPNNFGPNCPKPEWFMSKIQTKLFSLGLKSSNWTIMSKIQTSLAFRRSKTSEIQMKLIGFWTLSEKAKLKIGEKKVPPNWVWHCYEFGSD